MIFISIWVSLLKVKFCFLFSSPSSKWNNLAECEWVENVVTNRSCIDFFNLLVIAFAHWMTYYSRCRCWHFKISKFNRRLQSKVEKYASELLHFRHFKKTRKSKPILISILVWLNHCKIVKEELNVRWWDD